MANKCVVKIYPLAVQDLEQIFEYISIDLGNPTAGLKQINDFQMALDKVCEFPESCPVVKNEYVKDKTLRKLVVNNYIVFYRIRDNEIQVVRVIYGMRNYENLL